MSRIFDFIYTTYKQNNGVSNNINLVPDQITTVDLLLYILQSGSVF